MPDASCGRQSGTWIGSSLVRRVAAGLAAVVVAALAAACAPPPPPPPPPKPPIFEAACANTLVASSPGAVASAAITEASGIAASRRSDGVWWVHNDSGDRARVFAISDTGQTLGEYALSGATAVDWEDVAAGPGPTAGAPFLYVGDLGDNAGARASVQVYRVREPVVDPGAPVASPQTLGGVATLTLTYPDGAHDAEALLVDPTTGELFVITKDLVGGVARVFRAPANLAAGSTTMLTQVATVSLGAAQGVTAADVTPAGDVVALRTYLGVRLFRRTVGTPLADAFSQPSCAGAAPPFGSATPASEPQGEALGFTRDGRGYVTLSEGAHVALHRFTAP
jgi:hypothetical protein